MKVILNSDIVYTGRLDAKKLPKKLENLCGACRDRGHTVLVPHTTLLEYRRKQSELRCKAIEDLRRAYKLLDDYEIPYTPTDPCEAVKEPDLLELIRRSGVQVELEKPGIEDFVEAHHRACLHKPPHPVDLKSYEMRDLVIWMIALRVASENGGALLISRDKLHVNPSGDDEAKAVRLVRVSTIDEALEYFGVMTPAGTLMQRLLRAGWDDLLETDLPATDVSSITGISHCRFTQGIGGPSHASCNLKARTSEGKRLQARAEVSAENGIVTHIILSDVSVDDKTLDTPRFIATPNKSFGDEQDDFHDRITALREIL